ncbi:MAG: PAS domain S-box protein [Candidatus Rokubacteria bacterium]|nr:PAS domain S-box protein [Candidatus Rokubacteria bacterium]
MSTRPRRPAGSVAPSARTAGTVTARAGRPKASSLESPTAQACLDLAGVILVAIDREQRVTLINQKGCEVLGCAKEEILGANWFDRFIPERFREETRSVFRRLMGGRVEVAEYFENPVLTARGEERVIAWRNTVIRDARGRIAGTLSSGDDVTERRSAEDARRRSEATARTVLEAAAEGIVMVGPDGHTTMVNAKLEEMFGYRREELLGQPLEILLPERLRDTHAAHRLGYFTHPRPRPMGKGLGLDLIGRRKDSTEFPIEVSLSYMEAAGSVVAMAFVTDITERKRAELRLKTQFAVTQILAESGTLRDATPRLLQAVCEGVGWEVGELWALDARAGVLRRAGGWHQPAADLFGFDLRSRVVVLPPGAGLIGKVWASGEPALVTDVGADPTFARRQLAAEAGLKAAFAFPVRAGNEVFGVMAFFSRRPRQPDHDLLEVMADIGSRIGGYLERRRAEEQLQRQREVLYQGEKLAALGRLAAGVVHEMNNPLGIMLSRIELLLMAAEGPGVPAEVREDLQVLHRNTQRVARVAQSLLSFARHSPSEHGPVDLNHVVEETMVLVQKAMSADGVRITTALDPALPQLFGDPGALQQVLLNLLTNAREAMAGGGEIRIETGPAPDRPGWLRLVVSDTGPGIPPELTSRIFDPFFTTKPEGTGLGLSVSYGIVQDHHGTVDVQSEPGRGATFILSFPALQGSGA